MSFGAEAKPKTEEDTNPNAKVEQDLQDSIKRFSSAKTTLSDIKIDLDKSLKQLPERLQGNAYQKAQVKLGKLGKAFTNAEDVFKTGGEKLQKMYDGYIKIDEENKRREEEKWNMELVMGILLLVSIAVPFAIELLAPLCAECMVAFGAAEMEEVATVSSEVADLSEVDEITLTFEEGEVPGDLGDGIGSPTEDGPLGTPEGENIESYEINDPDPNGGDTVDAGDFSPEGDGVPEGQPTQVEIDPPGDNEEVGEGNPEGEDVQPYRIDDDESLAPGDNEDFNEPSPEGDDELGDDEDWDKAVEDIFLEDDDFLEEEDFLSNDRKRPFEDDQELDEPSKKIRPDDPEEGPSRTKRPFEDDEELDEPSKQFHAPELPDAPPPTPNELQPVVNDPLPSPSDEPLELPGSVITDPPFVPKDPEEWVDAIKGPGSYEPVEVTKLDGTKISTVNNPDGSVVVYDTETVINPITKQPTQVETITKTTAPDANGNWKVTKVVIDPATEHKYATIQTFGPDGNPTGAPTRMELDANDNLVQPSPVAGPSSQA